MTGVSLGLRAGSYGSLQQLQNGGVLQAAAAAGLVRRPSKALLYNPREKERVCPLICRQLGRGKVAMLLMVALGLFVFFFGCFALYNGGTITHEIDDTRSYAVSKYEVVETHGVEDNSRESNYSRVASLTSKDDRTAEWPPRSPSSAKARKGYFPAVSHQCDHFVFPPPPPADRRRPGPRPCPVCYIPVEQAIASMPSSPSKSPVIHTLNYVHDENPIQREPHGGSDFGGYPTVKERDAAFDIKETMTVHCGKL